MSDQVRREDVRFRSGELTLAGTFAMPAAEARPGQCWRVATQAVS
jgi:hypothetical protein